MKSWFKENKKKVCFFFPVPQLDWDWYGHVDPELPEAASCLWHLDPALGFKVEEECKPCPPPIPLTEF